MKNAVDQQQLRVQIDDYLYAADFESLGQLQASLNKCLDEVERKLAVFEQQPVDGVDAAGDYLSLVQTHWLLCQVLAYLLFRRQQTERQLLRAAVDGAVEAGTVPSQRRAKFLQRLVTEQDVDSAANALSVMRHMVGEFEHLQAKVRAGMQTAPLGALYEAEPAMEHAEDVLGTLMNDILFLERNFPGNS